MDWVFGLGVEFDAMGTKRMSLDSKYAYLSVIKDDFSFEGGDDSREGEPDSRTEKNETLSLYVSVNSSALFFLLSFSLRLEPA